MRSVARSDSRPRLRVSTRLPPIVAAARTCNMDSPFNMGVTQPELAWYACVQGVFCPAKRALFPCPHCYAVGQQVSVNFSELTLQLNCFLVPACQVCFPCFHQIARHRQLCSPELMKHLILMQSQGLGTLVAEQATAENERLTSPVGQLRQGLPDCQQCAGGAWPGESTLLQGRPCLRS